MATARRRAEWDRIAWLTASIINSNPFREGPPVTPAECNPMAPAEQLGSARAGIDCLDASAVSAYHDALQLRQLREDQH